MSEPLPAAMLAMIAGHFGETPGDCVRLGGGFSHTAFAFVLRGHRYVAKAASSDAYQRELWHEAETLVGLDRVTRGGVPHARQVAHISGADWHVLVLEFCDGAPGPQLFGGPARTRAAAYRHLARLLARLHRAEFAALRPLQNDAARASSFSLAKRATWGAQQLPTLALPDALQRPLLAALKHRAWRSANPVFVHGDAGLHNLLYRPGGSVLLDWEWAGWGPAQSDLAWLAWTLRWRKLEALWPATLDAYHRELGETSAWSAAHARAFVLGRIALLLIRSKDNPPMLAEWLRRAEFTLALRSIA